MGIIPTFKLSDHKFTVQACKGKPRRNTKWTTILEFGGTETEYWRDLRAAVRKFFQNKTGAGSIQTLVDGDEKCTQTVYYLEDKIHGVDCLHELPHIEN